MTSSCFDVFGACVEAVQSGELIEAVSASDKEFHFQIGSRQGSPAWKATSSQGDEIPTQTSLWSNVPRATR